MTEVVVGEKVLYYPPPGGISGCIAYIIPQEVTLKPMHFFLGLTLLLCSGTTLANETGTDLGLGIGQFMLSGDQAKGKGNGWTFRTMSIIEHENFVGGLGVEMGSAKIDNEGDKCCFVKDKSIEMYSFGINSTIMWKWFNPVQTGIEVGVHSMDLAQTDIKSNYGFTKFALIARVPFSDRLSGFFHYSYFLPVEEIAGDESYKLGASSLQLGASWFVPTETE